MRGFATHRDANTPSERESAEARQAKRKNIVSNRERKKRTNETERQLPFDAAHSLAKHQPRKELPARIFF